MTHRIALVGQMAAGKSTIGRALAKRLGVAFVDLDAAVVATTGRSIEAIFTLDGEAAFRAAERAELTRQLAINGDGLVLATGGGTPCQPGAMTELTQQTRVVWLRARPETLARRANGGAGRPLLTGKNLDAIRSSLAAQLVERLPYYALANLVIDVDDLSSEAAIAQIVERLQLVPDASCEDSRPSVGSTTALPNTPTTMTVPMPKTTTTTTTTSPATTAEPSDALSLRVELTSAASASYTITFPTSGFGQALQQSLSNDCPKASRALIVTDSNVGPLYASLAEQAARDAGLAVGRVTIAAGESSKSMATLNTLLDTALSRGLTRTDVLIALGGGVVGDLTGLAASLLHRGIAVIQVPTTLLAQVDSSVGGKTAVNHAAGKNLIGAFWQPRSVIASYQVLTTLPAREVRCGLAEALKHGFIADPALLAFANDHAQSIAKLEPATVCELVQRCCAIKAAVVAEDERDQGRRAILNFGHTFGHAFERLQGYGALTHGEAVGLGMVLAARVSTRAGDVGVELVERVKNTLVRHGLPDDPDAFGHTPAELVDAARSDKKADSRGVRFILLDAIGVPRIAHITWRQLEEWIA